MEAEFKKAAEEVQKLKTRPSNNDLLALYGLYKQGSEGDNNTSKPGFFDMKGSAKWNAWNEHKGKLTKEQAQEKYIELVKQYKEKYGY